jgi:hypothetical protein
MIEGFVAAGARKEAAKACVAAAIRAAGEASWAGSGPPPWIAEGAPFVVTPFTRMLESAVGQGALPASGPQQSPPGPRASGGKSWAGAAGEGLFEKMAGIEAAAGAPPEKGRAHAQALLRQVKDMLAKGQAAPEMSAGEMRAAAEKLTQLVAPGKADAAPAPPEAPRMRSGARP